MTHPNPSTAVASVLVDELIRNGVRTFVVAPGSRSAPLSMAAAGDERVSLIVCIDERSAGFEAVGLGRAGTPAAVIVTSGSAVANLLPAVVEGSMANVPMIILSADRPPELRGVGANQTIDQIGLFGRYVRSFVELGVPEDHPRSNGYWRSTVCRSLAHAFGRLGPAGPVHVNVALREPLVPTVDDGRSVAQPFQADTSGRGHGGPWTVDPATDVSAPPLPDSFVQSERGLVVAGTGADVGWSDRAAAALGWPLICESTAGARPDQTITTAHLLAATPTFADRHHPEAVLAIGRIGLSRSVATLCQGAMTATIDPSGWMDSTSSARIVLNAYPGLDPHDVPGRPTGWRRRWLEAEAAARGALDAALDDEEGITELRTARDTARGASGGVLVAASSMPIRDLDVVLETGLSPSCPIAVRRASTDSSRPPSGLLEPNPVWWRSQVISRCCTTKTAFSRDRFPRPCSSSLTTTEAESSRFSRRQHSRRSSSECSGRLTGAPFTTTPFFMGWSTRRSGIRLH